MAFKSSLIIRKMKKGVKAKSSEPEGGQLEAQNVKIVTKDGIQIPFGMPMGFPAAGPAAPASDTTQFKIPEGITISPTIQPRGAPIHSSEEHDEVRGIDLKYSLIPPNPQQGQRVFAYTNILWERGELVYMVKEPSLQQHEKEVIEKIKKDLEERLDIDFNKLGEIKGKQLLREEIQKSFLMFPGITEDHKLNLVYYIERDLLGMGKIETLMADPNIEDISCDGVGVPIYVYHRDSKFGSMKSNIVFDTEDELNSFVNILAQRTNKTISIAEPLLDGALPDGSRVQATLGTDIARKGSNFTIRKFTDKPLTPTHMLKFGTLDATELAYLWLAIENGKTVLVSGGTATGKTSLLNALSLFIRPGLKVVSIEDTAELRLPLPHWIPQVARTPLSLKGNVGEVSLFDLLKTSLRQRPDYIIVGEVRGREAFVLFQQIATGHAAMATIHAASIPQLIDRLITPPISLPPSLLENIDIVVFLSRTRLHGSYVRRTDSILEVVGIKDEKPFTIKIFEWLPMTDKFNIKEKSVVLRNISRRLGLTEQSILEELARRKKILEWMVDQEIMDYREVARVISTYYADPERVMDVIDST